VAKLAVIGVGFTGASLALALRPSKLFDQIAAYDVDRRRLQTAKRLGAIDQEARSPAAAAEQAAVIVACVPSQELPTVFQAIRGSLAAGAVVTETSLWKQAALTAASALPEEVHFVGGRPVLDRRGDGPEGASADAFRNAIYCLTPAAHANAAAINAVSAIATGAGAQPYFLEPAEHDALTTATELLPSAVLASLTAALTSDRSWSEAGKLAGDAFERVAALTEGLDRDFWEQAQANSASLARWLETAGAALMDLGRQIEAADAKDLKADWQATLAAVTRWQGQRRQLQESVMPPKAELRPSIFGALGTLRPRR
jgi:prephenate dehydrogenase